MQCHKEDVFNKTFFYLSVLIKTYTTQIIIMPRQMQRAPISYIDRLCSKLRLPYVLKENARTYKKKPSAYNLFVKKHFHDMKYRGLSPNDILTQLSTDYKIHKGDPEYMANGYIGGRRRGRALIAGCNTRKCKGKGRGGSSAQMLSRLRAMLASRRR